MAIDESSSNGPEHRRRHDVLESHRTRGTPFLAYVNPKDPAQSLLFREPGAGMYILPPFGLVFAMVGGGMMVYGLVQIRRERARAAGKKRHQGRQWRAEPAFARGFTIESNAVGSLALSWGVAVFVTLFMSIFWIGLTGDGHAPFIAWAIIGLFTALDLALLWSAVYLSLQFARYGVSRLELTEIPVVPGRMLRARVIIGRRLRADVGVHLRVVGRRTVGSGKHRTTTDFFSAEQTVRESRGVDGDSVDVRIEIPPDVPARAPDASPAITWTLEVKAATPGVDFAAEFDLPVYNVENEGLIEHRPGALAPLGRAAPG